MQKKILILGGTGFVGKHLASRLVSLGHRVKVLSRRREEHRELLVLPTLELVSANPYDLEQLNQQVAGCDVVINLVGILNEKGSDGAGFRKAHVELTKTVVSACQTNRVEHLLHMSALNADAQQGKSHYLRTKGEAEDFVHAQTVVPVTSFRPSVIFGYDDSFFNRFARLLRVSPGFFPLACPHSRLAPVWIDDVVNIFVQSVGNPQHYGKRYNLCGPKIYTLKQLVEYTVGLIGGKHYIIPLNDTWSARQARWMELLPGKPFSQDNYLSLQTDSICTDSPWELFHLQPNSIEVVVPQYFTRTSPRDFYDEFRHQARREW